MSSIGAEILTALKARLETITTAAGYGSTVKKVYLDRIGPASAESAIDLPCIQIMQDHEDYQHNGASSTYQADQFIVLFLVAEKQWSDAQMEDFMRDVRKCLYGGAADASGNTGITLGGKVSGIWLVGAVADLNMIDSNRVYQLTVKLRSTRTTYRD